MAGAIGNLAVILSLNSSGLAGESTKAVSSVKNMAGGISSSFTSMGKTAMASGAAIASGIGSVVSGVSKIGSILSAQAQPGIQFEKDMSRVAAILDATGPVYDSLEKKALQLGATTEFTAAQVAQAMSELATGGLSATQVLDAIGPALNLARVSGMDLKDTADLLAVSMGAFNLTASETSRVADVLSLAAIKTSSSVADLGEAFKFAAPAAAATGRDVEEVTAALAIMAKSGIRGSMAGSALRGIMMKMSRPTAEAAAALKDVGVEFWDAEGKAKGFAQIVTEVMAAVGDMNQQQQLEFFGTQFEARAATGFISLKNKGPAAIKEFEDMLRAGSAGTAERIGARQIENVWGGLKILESAFENVGVRLFNIVKKPYREMTLGAADWLVGIGNSLEGSLNKAKDAFTKPFTDAFSGMGTSIEKSLGPGWEKVKAAFAGGIDFGPAVAGFMRYSEFLQAQLDRLLAFIEPLWSKVTDALSGNFDFGPLLAMQGAVFGVLQTGFDLLLTSMENVGAMFTWLGEKISEQIDWGEFREGFITTFVAIEFAALNWQKTLSSGWVAVKLGAVTMYEDINAILGNGLTALLTMSGDVWTTGIGAFAESFQTVANSIGEMVSQMATRIVEMLKKMWDDAKSGKFDSDALKWERIIGDPTAAMDEAWKKTSDSMKGKTEKFGKEEWGKIFKDRKKTDLEKSLQEELAAINLMGDFDAFGKKRRQEIEAMLKTLNPGGKAESPTDGGKPTPGMPGRKPPPLGSEPFQFSSLVVKGTKDAIEAEMKFRAEMQGRDKEDVQKAQLKKQESMDKALNDIRELLKKSTIEFEFA